MTIEKNKYVLNLAPNGVMPTKALTPHVPTTPQEVVADLKECMNAGGITYLHLHARDENGENTSSKTIYAKYIDAIKNEFEHLPICVSCSGRIDPSFEKRAEVLNLQGDLKPDMASLTLGSLNFSKTASINSPDTIVRLAEKMAEQNIKPELEIFDVGMMNFAQYMISKGYLKTPYYFNIILGNLFSAQAKESHLKIILDEMPKNSIWSIGGIGNAQQPAHLMAFKNGGGIRTGIEDNIWLDDERTQLATNASLVKRIHDMNKNSEMMDMISFKSFLLDKNPPVMRA